MRKLSALLVIAALMTPVLGTTASAAGSASVSITNTKNVQQGRSYTYTIKIDFKDTAFAIGDVKFSGAFLHKTEDFEFSGGGVNKNGSVTIKATLKVPSDAVIGSTGTITVSGQGSHYLGGGKFSEYTISKSFTATVIKYVPTPTKPPTAWDIAAQGVAKLKAGGALSMKAPADSTIPAALLSALREKQAKLTVDLGNCTCEIDGAALRGVPGGDPIDLAVTMEKDAALSEAAGGADIYQMHFAHSGQLPGPFAYTFKAEANRPGDTLYLYFYYGRPGVVEGTQSAVVDENGFVTFRIYHCSSYFAADRILEGAYGIVSPSAGNAPAETSGPPSGAQQAAPAEPAASGEPAVLAETEAQLRAAQDAQLRIEENVRQMELQLAAARKDAAAFLAETEGRLSVEPAALILIVGAAALLAVFLTMLLCRAGLFRRRDQ